MIIKLLDYLHDNNIDAYFIGQHKGECISPYVVLKDSGTSGYLNNKNGVKLIDIIFYLPQNQFSRVESFRKCVFDLLNNYKDIRYTGDETGVITDDNKKAITFSIMYENQRKL